MKRLAACALVVLLSFAGAFAGDDGKKPAKPDDKGAKKEEEKEPEDVAALATEDLKAGGDEKKRFFVHGPKKNAKQPKDGWKVLYLLPGGTGDAGFKAFVKRIALNALSDDYLEVQLVSVKWRDDQDTVWPTKFVRARDQKFTTEEFFAAVHKDVTAKWKIDPKRVFMLGWSSGGPPTYVLTLQEKSPITGAYLAMSVFRPNWMPSIDGAKGKGFFIDHSPEDQTCDFKMAEQARDALKKAGGDVEFETYAGGHGWQGDMFGRMKRGIAHLEKHAGK